MLNYFQSLTNGQNGMQIGYVKDIPEFHDILAHGGFHAPTILYHEGKTIFVGEHSNHEDYYNQGLIVTYDNATNRVEWKDFGTKRVRYDLNNHPYPAMLIHPVTEYLYIAQVNVHNDPIELYKSEYPVTHADFMNGDFVLHHTIDPIGDTGKGYAYLTMRWLSDYTMKIFTRCTNVGTNDIGAQCILLSDGTDYTTWTHKTTALTDQMGVDRRFYPNMLPNYGTCTKHVYLASIRVTELGIIKYRAHALYSTPISGDFTEFSNVTGTLFEKTITNTGATITSAFTLAEVRANLVVNGDDTDSDIDVARGKGCQIDDIIYLTCKKGDTGEGEIIKIDNRVLTRHDVPDIDIPTFVSTVQIQIYPSRVDSDRLLVTFNLAFGTSDQYAELWTVDKATITDWKKELTVPKYTAAIGMPFNHHEIPDEEKYAVSLGVVTLDDPEFWKYGITTKKY